MEPAPAKSVIELRPFDPSDLPLVWQWSQKFWWSVCDDDVPQPQTEFVLFKQMQNSINLAVYRDGQLGGILSCDPVNSWVCQAHAIFRKEMWGSAFTVPALQLGLDFAFDKLGYRKVACVVYSHNARMRALIEKVGGKQEGYHVGQTKQQGEWVDMVSYGIFKLEESE